MNNIKLLFSAVGLVAASNALADVYQGQRERWLEMAENCKPELVETIVRPKGVVAPVADNSAYQNWRFDFLGNPDSLLYNQNFKDIKEITLDFGDHYTGYFTFSTKTLSRCQDAPVRICIFLGENPAELNTPLEPWPGTLSRAWMQDETVTITQVDQEITIPRRMAFRYAKIRLLGASPDFDFAINDVYAKAYTSAANNGESLLPDCPDRIKRIHDVGLATLRECMQTVYEDGPKRDRRLWAGDLYLESLANSHSFKNFNLTKRCLYLFAALADDDGRVLSNIFETPQPHPQYFSHCLTYSLLWNSTLLEYLKDTGDEKTAVDLWPVAKKQVEEALEYVDNRGIFNRSLKDSYMWMFFDWREGLDMEVPMQGAVICALNQTYELACMLGREQEIKEWPAFSKKMQNAAKKFLFNKNSGVFLSGPEKQLSVLSQAWMIKAGVISGKQAQKALKISLDREDSYKPGTPYATHYLVESMILCGMHNEARSYLLEYWGGMVDKGADTFWEAYDPADDFISPYKFAPLNSSCHAWSCTPVYFIHKYPHIFQKAEE